MLEACGLRAIEVGLVSKMLICGSSILGVKQYTCSGGRCLHVKDLCNTCHCRACPSCSKKATDQRYLFQIPVNWCLALQACPFCAGLGRLKSQALQARRCVKVLQNGLVQYELAKS